MKQIKLHSITLNNWRGEKARMTIFNEDFPTYIMGSNGLGKSRHFDAFCWLLFGKDSLDRKDYAIRSYDADGNILHHCECSVSAVLIIDGTSIDIKREYKEQWVKPRGQIDEVFKGNVTECSWNGVPVKVSEFQKRVNDEIIDDTLFKMITNPCYFLSTMKWQQQRECLLQMAGTASDEEIAATSDDFRALLDSLKGKSLSDYKKEIALEKKRLKASLAEIQPRIDQTQKMAPEAEDWTGIEKEIDEHNTRLSDIDRQLSSAEERQQAADDKAAGIRKLIAEKKAQQDEAVDKYREQQKAIAHEQNAARRDIEDRLKDANSRLSSLNIDIKRTQERIDHCEQRIAYINDIKLGQLREEWRTINASKYDGSDICPHCGQRLPEEQIANAQAKFKEYKAAQLKENNEKGQALVKERNDFEAELKEKKASAGKLDADIKAQQAEIDSLYKQLEECPKRTDIVKPFNSIDVPGYNALQFDIDSLKAQLDTPAGDDDEQRRALSAQRKEEQAALDMLKQRLAKRDAIDAANKEIERLTEQGRDLAQQLADIEKREYTAMQFSRKKIEDCEQRINNMFTLVHFKLFDTTQDGNEFETCIPMVNGVPYDAANTAGQINAGLDVINTLTRFHNTSAPIFIDNAESVNFFLDVDAQIVFLKVSDDKELVVKSVSL